MIQYKISYTHPHRHFIDFEMIIPPMGTDKLQIQLPSWRPGRYELGNFAKNIRALVVDDLKGEMLSFKKINKDLWEILGAKNKSVRVRYSFYADVLNAGSTFLDEAQLYINPVNCFFYVPKHPNLSYELKFEVPAAYEFATGLEKKGSRKYFAKDFQVLFDSPLMISDSLQHLTYKCQGIKFHVWIQGDHQIDAKEFVKDHQDFTEKQLRAFGDIPCSEYHFLYEFPDYPVRHGVEHCNSTVIAMGPGSTLHEKKNYQEVIGIACHELYHTWNVKSIRPKEMMPYNFSRENYSELGYVAEGVTTYFGDQYLCRTGFFSEEEYIEILEKSMDRHLMNRGRHNLSVAESSFDTWLDGYVPGIPWRKVSIYNEGQLIALMCDLRIIRSTEGHSSLDTVMADLYEKFGKRNIGYTEKDYKKILERVSGASFDDIFESFVHGTEDYIDGLNSEFKFFGLKISYTENPKNYIRNYGLVCDDRNNVVLIEPESPADKAKIWIGDQVLAIDGYKIKSGLSSHFDQKNEKNIKMLLVRKSSIFEVILKKSSKKYFPVTKVAKNSKFNKNLYNSWIRNDS